MPTKRTRRGGRRAWASIREARELGNLEDARRRANANRNLLAYRGAFNRVQRVLSNLRKEITRIHMDDNLSAQQKRRQIDSLNQRKKALAREVIERTSGGFR